MDYLARVNELPSDDDLTETDRKLLRRHFDANAYELNIDGETLEWGLIEEIEVVKAARQNSPAGWLVRNVWFGGDRYHVGIYFGKEEMILPNLSLEAARYVLHTIAYYCRHDVRYTGISDAAPVRNNGTDDGG